MKVDTKEINWSKCHESIDRICKYMVANGIWYSREDEQIAAKYNHMNKS